MSLACFQREQSFLPDASFHWLLRQDPNRSTQEIGSVSDPRLRDACESLANSLLGLLVCLCCQFLRVSVYLLNGQDSGRWLVHLFFFFVIMKTWYKLGEKIQVRHWPSEKHKSKWYWGSISFWLKWWSRRRQISAKAAEDVRRGPLHRLVGMLLAQSLGKSIWQLPGQRAIAPPCDSAVPLQGVYPKASKSTHRSNIWSSASALVTAAQSWSRPMGTDEGDVVQVQPHNGIFVIRGKGIKTCHFWENEWSWWEMSQLSQSQKDKYYVFCPLWFLDFVAMHKIMLACMA